MPSYIRLEIIDDPACAASLANVEARCGIFAPIPTLEYVGRLVEGDAIVLAGGVGMGKSTQACRLIADVCIKQKTPSIFFSTEMNRNDVGGWVAAIILKRSVDSLQKNFLNLPWINCLRRPSRLSTLAPSEWTTSKSMCAARWARVWSFSIISRASPLEGARAAR